MSMKKGSNVKCKLCGKKYFYRTLTFHLKREHKFTQKDFIEYHFKYLRNSSEEGICKCIGCTERTVLLSNHINLKIRYGKFCQKHNYCSRITPTNLKYWIDIFGMTEQEAEEARKPCISNASEKLKIRRKEGRPFYIPSQLEYWLEKTSGNEEEAKKLHSERQSTFSKEKCIEKNGEEEGLKRWEERQAKWQETLNKKPEEERIIINKKKIKGIISRDHKGYSKISQQLFKEIYELIKTKFECVYFATLCRDGTVIDDGKNREYILDVGHSYRLLDFYIPSIKKCIEFDGEYWHNYKTGFRGNKERDTLREQQIKKQKISILHIKERDYNDNKEKVIEECLRFIYE